MIYKDIFAMNYALPWRKGILDKAKKVILHPLVHLSPFNITGVHWTKVGPSGKGLDARILDVLNLRRDTHLIQKVDYLGVALRDLGG